jgi:glycosyltransferase involved in cell wall biosynthesis
MEDNSWWSRDADHLRLVYVGIMSEYRGCIDLARATAQVHADGLPVELVMLGPGATNIRSKVDAIAHNAPISVMDPIDSSEIPGLLKSASVGCSPLWDIQKYRSSYPIKVNEYLASGLPVLASDTPGHRTAIPDNCGRFFTPRDVGALSSAIVGMYSNSQWRSDAGKAATDVAASRDWSTVIRSLAERLGDLIHHKFAPR